MAWVYMLRGASGRHYIGSTTHLGWRIEEHRRGHTHTTKRLGGEVEIVAALELPTLKEARAKRIRSLRSDYCSAEVRDESWQRSPEGFRGWSRVRVPANPPFHALKAVRSGGAALLAWDARICLNAQNAVTGPR
jgi:predicted GIY-YIG superfamily endonuclease